MGKCCFHVKYVQTDRQTDNGKTIYPQIFRCKGIKKIQVLNKIYEVVFKLLQGPHVAQW